MDPTIEALLRYFEYRDLHEPLQAVSRPFHDLVHAVVADAGPSGGPELELVVRRLLEAKDGAVRMAAGRRGLA
jgi:hypothetical protein